jgi:hypothetical protein
MTYWDKGVKVCEVCVCMVDLREYEGLRASHNTYLMDVMVCALNFSPLLT